MAQAPVIPAPLRASAQKPLAAITLDNTALFTWAQWHYTQYFSGGYDTGTYDGYAYRHYPTTGNYLGIKNGEVFVMGPVSGGNILHVGAMSAFECQVLPANCPVTAPAASPGVAVSGLYYFGDAGVFVMGADGSFVGFNPGATKADIFSGNATVQATTWSAPSVVYGQLSPGSTSAARAPAGITASYSTGIAQTATLTVTQAVPVNSRIAMDYHPQSTSASSLWTVGGTYRTPSAGQAIDIDPNSGAVSGTFVTGCTIAGNMSVIDGNRNIYRMSANLTGSACPVQGASSFLAMYYDQGVENQALLLYGTTTGADLNFAWLTFARNGDGL